jgi:hypothetical protein
VAPHSQSGGSLLVCRSVGRWVGLVPLALALALALALLLSHPFGSFLSLFVCSHYTHGNCVFATLRVAAGDDDDDDVRGFYRCC